MEYRYSRMMNQRTTARQATWQRFQSVSRCDFPPDRSIGDIPISEQIERGRGAAPEVVRGARCLRFHLGCADEPKMRGLILIFGSLWEKQNQELRHSAAPGSVLLRQFHSSCLWQ